MAESTPTDHPPADRPRADGSAADASADGPAADGPALGASSDSCTVGASAAASSDSPTVGASAAASPGQSTADQPAAGASGDERPVGYWVKLVNDLVEERFAATLDEHGVTRRQWQLLSLLRRGPASRDELDVAVAPFAAATAPDADADAELGASTLAELDELIESEWVADSPSGFVLLPKGEQSFERLFELVGGIRSTVTSGVEDAAYSTTVRTLEQMARNLGWRG